MPVTDLTNTTWLFSETIPFSSTRWYKYFTNIQFKSAASDTIYSRFYIAVSSYDANIQYGWSDAYNSYNNVNWKKNLYRIITFTGGTDARKAALINIITTYATPLPRYYRASEDDYKAVADAIRAKGGTSEALTFPQGFVDAIGAISGGQYGNELISVLDGSARELRNLPSALTKIKPYAFYRSKNLPAGYVPLESVRANGNTVIQTEIPYNNISSITFEASLDGPLSHSQVVLGFERGGNGGTYFGAMPNKAIWSVGTGTSNE